MNADGSNPERLTNTAGVEYCLRWSPDGTKIAFSSNRDGGSWHEIYVMNADDGSEQTRLTTFGRAFDPDWGPAPNTD